MKSFSFLVCLFFSINVFAKDWVMLQSTEPSPEQTLRTMLFLQPQYAFSLGERLSAGPFQGEKGIFNLNGPEFRDTASFQIVRAFANARGNVPGTEGKINYLGMVDFGETLMTGSERTTESPTNLQLADLSLTFNYIPYARLRLGQFITPSSNEMMRAVHFYDFINFSNFTIFTMLDWNMPTPGDGTTANRPAHPNAGFRDIGLMLFDKVTIGNTEHTYSVMVGNGNGISRWENDGSHDVHWRYRLGLNFNPENELEFVLWGTNGNRTLEVAGIPTAFKRERVGTDLSLKFSNWRVDMAYGYAEGIIFHGTLGAGQPGITNGANQVASFLTLPEETARGYQVAVNYDLMKQYTFGVRYDQVNYGLNIPANERIFDTLALSTQYKFDPQSLTRLILNYEFRNAEAPKLADSHAVNRFLSGVGDRVSLNLFWFL